MGQHQPSKKGGKRPPSQRQLRVGEEIRHALADVFFRGETHIPELEQVSITVSQAKVSPDLKNATVYVAPLAGQMADSIVPLLNEAAPLLRKHMNKRIVLKYSPKLYFKLDTSFEEAQKINRLLQNPEIQKDLESNDSQSEESVS